MAERLERVWGGPATLWGGLTTVDHKKIGRRYLVTALAFLLVGGVEALLMRLQLIGPERKTLSPEAYNQLFTMHGLTMIMWYAAPILSGFGNFLVPLLIGSRDMSFPRLNAFSYWMFLASGILLYASVACGQSPDAGWFAYAPLSGRRYGADLNLDFYAVAMTALTISTTVGAVNFIVTIFKHRAPGMTPARMPLFLYSTGTTAFLSLLALPALTVACVFLELDRRWGTHFFEARQGGDPLLWQHLFWFFGHPWVYVVFLPATGMISMLVPVYARRPIVGHPLVAASTVLTGVVGMGVWVHHMFAVGMAQMAMSFFSAASMTISLFSTIQIFCWVATLWLGRPVRTASLLFALGFIATFVIGGLSGVITAVIPFDWQVHDTYFVVAHLHYVLIGANVFPVFAALYYWWPKLTGRMLDERLGKLSFWMMFVGFNAGFFPMHLSGMLGMRRRVYTYLAEDGLGVLNLLTSLGSVLLALGILVSLVAFAKSFRAGRTALPNPWAADTLEWLTPSPPPSYGFLRIPTVESLHPLWDDHDELADPRNERTLERGRQTLSTTVIDAVPSAISKGEDDTIVPLLLAGAITGLLALLMTKCLLPAGALVVAAVGLAFGWLWPKREERPV
ncbi:MAG TPA: cytochrome c oxidase subunit I [Polyangia bacterium]|nr:cytochrome c oxidase subunit I [Polyangia bacterium]